MFFQKFLKKFSVFGLVLSLVFIPILCTSTAHAVNKDVTMVFVGNRSSGKTALATKLTGQRFDFTERHPTLEPFICNGHFLPYNSQITLNFNVMDATGDGNLKTQIMNFPKVKDAHCIVVAIDLEAEVTGGYQNLSKQALNQWYLPLREKNPRCLIIIAGTKSDKISEEKLKEVEGKFKSLVDVLEDIKYITTSAKKIQQDEDRRSEEGRKAAEEAILKFFNLVFANINVNALPANQTTVIRKMPCKAGDRCLTPGKHYIEGSDYYGYCNEACYKNTSCIIL